MSKKTTTVKAIAPEQCDICRGELRKNTFFYDGATQMGPWAWMCADCFAAVGRGLGVGRGQRYYSVNNEKCMDAPIKPALTYSQWVTLRASAASMRGGK